MLDVSQTVRQTTGICSPLTEDLPPLPPIPYQTHQEEKKRRMVHSSHDIKMKYSSGTNLRDLLTKTNTTHPRLPHLTPNVIYKISCKAVTTAQLPTTDKPTALFTRDSQNMSETQEIPPSLTARLTLLPTSQLRLTTLGLQVTPLAGPTQPS